MKVGGQPWQFKYLTIDLSLLIVVLLSVSCRQHISQTTIFSPEVSIVVQSHNRLGLEYLCSVFIERIESDYPLRDSNKLFLPPPRNNNLRSSFSYIGANLWSSLSCRLRDVKSLNQFKLNTQHLWKAGLVCNTFCCNK